MLQVWTKNILPNLMASSVGCSPSGGRIGWGSWMLNQVTLICSLQTDMFHPPPVSDTSSDTLSVLLSAIIQQWTAWQQVRQNSRIEHHVHTKQTNNICFHPLLYDLYHCCCHLLSPMHVSQYLFLLLQYLTVIWQMLLLKATNKSHIYC